MQVELNWFGLVLFVWFEIRVLKSEVEELEELKKEKERYFASKTREMEDFNAQVENFAVGCGMHVEKLKNQMEEVT